MTVLDFRPLLDGVVFPVLVSVITPIIAWAVYKVGKVAHVTFTQGQAHVLEVAMQNGINFALNRAQAAADAHATVATKSDVVAAAVNYVLPKVPGALNSLGISPVGLAQRIEARLPQGVGNVSSPNSTSQ